MDHFSIRASRIRVVHHGRPDRPAAARTSPDTPFLLSVSSFAPNKGMPLLVRAFAQVAPQWPGNLVIAARPERDLDAVKNLIAEAGLAERVRLILDAPDSQLDELYAGATVFVFPSAYETFGLPLLEAMNAGLPVVTRAVTACPEVVADAGVLINDDSPEALAAALLELLNSPEHLKERAEQSTRRAQRFSWKKAAEATWDAITACIEAPALRRADA